MHSFVTTVVDSKFIKSILLFKIILSGLKDAREKVSNVDTGQLIKKLKTSNLYAECPCGEEFKLSEAILFDGAKPFPEEALQTQNNETAFLSF
jgi:hypothetical protein